MQRYPSGTIYRRPSPKQIGVCHAVHIIAIWNAKDRNCLDACNKYRLKELAKEIPEAKWEINYIQNAPYPTAFSTEKTPGGLNKVS